jgi:hypothetical protein
MITAFLLKWRAVLIAIGASYAIGAATGSFVTYRVVDYGRLEAAASEARSELRRYQKAVGIASDIDDETISWDATNDQIVSAIIRKARSLDANIPVPPSARAVCVSADSMCELHRLKLFTSSPAGERAQCREDHRVAIETERETTELIARLRASEVKNANAVNACKRYWAKVNKIWSGK